MADNADLFNRLRLLWESGGNLTKIEAVDGATESDVEEYDLDVDDDSDEECAADGLWKPQGALSLDCSIVLLYVIFSVSLLTSKKIIMYYFYSMHCVFLLIAIDWCE